MPGGDHCGRHPPGEPIVACRAAVIPDGAHVGVPPILALDNSVADNTRTAYDRQWTRFAAWCDEHGRTALPATPETLAEFVVALIDAGKGVSTISQAIATVRTRHRLAGYLDAPNADAARLALRSHRREVGDAGQRARQAPPVTIDTLRAMIDATPADTAAGARDRLVLVLGLAMMGRRSELAALHLSDVVETDDGLEVFVGRSKRDQDAKGAVVAVPRGSHPDIDPVRVLRRWRDVLAAQGITSGRLLRSITRHGRIGDRLGADVINDIVQRAAVRAGLPDAAAYTRSRCGSTSTHPGSLPPDRLVPRVGVAHAPGCLAP